MLFHAGVIWRLYEAGVLQRLDRIASVSVGSVTAAVLALAWPRLSFARIQLEQDFVPHFVTPLRRLAAETIDVQSVIEGILTPGAINDKVEGLYDGFLFHGATLQNLPERPRFILNATNVQTGGLWRFSRPFMGDCQVGRIPNPTLSLSKASAASAAFPPFLSPAILPLDETTFNPTSRGPSAFLLTRPAPSSATAASATTSLSSPSTNAAPPSSSATLAQSSTPNPSPKRTGSSTLPASP